MITADAHTRPAWRVDALGGEGHLRHRRSHRTHLIHALVPRLELAVDLVAQRVEIVGGGETADLLIGICIRLMQSLMIASIGVGLGGGRGVLRLTQIRRIGGLGAGRHIGYLAFVTGTAHLTSTSCDKPTLSCDFAPSSQD